MYLSRYSSLDNSSLTKGKYYSYQPSTRRKVSTQRPSTSYKTSYSSAKTAIKTQYKTKDNGFERPSSRHSNKRITYNQTYRRTARKTGARTLRKSSSKPIKTYYNNTQKFTVDLSPSFKSIPLSKSKKKLMPDFHGESAKKLKPKQDNAYLQQYKEYENYSVKDLPSMKYLESMLAKINLKRADIELEDIKKSISDYPYFGSNAGYGTSRTVNSKFNHAKVKTKRKMNNLPTDRPSRKKSKNKHMKMRYKRHDSGRTLQKLAYGSYPRTKSKNYRPSTTATIRKTVDIDKDFKAMRKSHSSADVGPVSIRRLQSAHPITKKKKATVASRHMNTSRKIRNTASDQGSSKKKKKSRSAQHMVTHGNTTHNNSGKEITEIWDIKGAKKRDNRSISDSQMHNVSNVKALKMKDLDIKSLLGEGAFSKVFLVKFKDTANVRKHITDKLRSNCPQIALKVIPRKKKSKKDKDSKNLMWERLVLSQLKHPFIVQYFGTFSDEKRVCILMEFIIGGEILYHFENCRLGRFPPNVSRFYIAEIICALEYVHSTGFIYRDLKPENILLDHKGHVKMVDFGFAKQLKQNEMTYTLCGSKEYVAPEVLVGNGHNKCVDLWSLGVLCFEFVIGHLPFPTQDSNPYEVLDIIRSTKLVFPQFVSKIIANFIKRLLTLNPKKRLGNDGFDQVKNHSWFQEFDWIKCNSKQLKPPIIPRYNSEDDVTNFASARFDDDVGNDDNYNAFKDLQLF